MPALPLGDETLVSLSAREIDALIEVATFEIDEVPDDFWNPDIRHDLWTALVKLKAVQG